MSGSNSAVTRRLFAAQTVMNAAVEDTLETRSADRDPFLHLPPELASATFRLLDFWDRIAVSHVSRDWRALALADARLWSEVDLKSPAVPQPPMMPPRLVFPTGGAQVPLNQSRHIVFPSPSPPKPPRHRAAEMLVELLARSYPLPFTLVWPGSRRSLAPHDAVTVIAQNMRRMQALVLAVDVSDIQRLLEERAPLLRSFSCTGYSALCELPTRWDAPLLETLELEHVRVPTGMQPLPSVRSFTCYALIDLGRTRTRLFSAFPSLRSLKIEALMNDTLPALSNPPPSLTHIDLRTNRGPTVDYGPLLHACAGSNVQTLYLESAVSFIDALELFVSTVVSTWRMTLDNTHARKIMLSATDEVEDVYYRVDCARTLSLQREPRIALHLARLASLTAHAQLIVDLDALGGWSRALPELRDLKIHFATWEQLDAPPPSPPHTPIDAPRLEAVVFELNESTAACKAWITGVFPGLLSSRFRLARPRLASVTINTWLERGPEEAGIAALLSLTERLRVHLRRYDKILEYGGQAAQYAS